MREKKRKGERLSEREREKEKGRKIKIKREMKIAKNEDRNKARRDQISK